MIVEPSSEINVYRWFVPPTRYDIFTNILKYIMNQKTWTLRFWTHLSWYWLCCIEYPLHSVRKNYHLPWHLVWWEKQFYWIVHLMFISIVGIRARHNMVLLDPWHTCRRGHHFVVPSDQTEVHYQHLECISHKIYQSMFFGSICGCIFTT